MKRLILILALLAAIPAYGQWNGFQPNVTGGNTLKINVSDGDISSTLGLFKQVAQTFVMTTNATNYVYLDLSVSPPVLKVNTTGFPVVNVYQIATVVTDSAKITAWHDSRPPFNNLLYGGGSGSQVCFQINGVDLPCEPKVNVVSPLTAVDNPGATRTDLGIAVCAGGASHTSGVIPDPGVTPDTTKFWRSDCTLAVPSSASVSLPNPVISGSLLSAPPWLLNVDTGFIGPNPYNDIRSYGTISSSATSTTANCASGSAGIALSSAIDFADGQGIVLYGCGPNTSLATPAAPTTVTPIGILNGSTTYTYKVVAEDNAGGLSQASSGTSTTTGAASLGSNCVNISSISRVSGITTVTTSGNHNFQQFATVFISGLGANSSFGGSNVITTAGTNTFVIKQLTQTDLTSGATGTACVAARNRVQWAHNSGEVRYWIYRNDVLVGAQQDSEPTWDDWGWSLTNGSVPSYVPASPPGAAWPQELVSTISSGGGTTSITLANTAGNNQTATTAKHDNSTAFLAAVAAAKSGGGPVYIPAGTSPVFNAWTVLPSNGGNSPVVRILIAGGMTVNQPVYVSQNNGHYAFEGYAGSGTAPSFTNTYQAPFSGAGFPLFFCDNCNTISFDHVNVATQSVAQQAGLIFAGAVTTSLKNSSFGAYYQGGQAVTYRGNNFDHRIFDNSFSINGTQTYYSYGALRGTSSKIQNPQALGFGISYIERNSFVGQGIEFDNDAGVTIGANGVQYVYVDKTFTESLGGPVIRFAANTVNLTSFTLNFDGLDTADTASGCGTPLIEATNSLFSQAPIIKNFITLCTEPILAGVSQALNSTGGLGASFTNYVPPDLTTGVGISGSHIDVANGYINGSGVTIFNAGQIANPTAGPTIGFTTIGCTGNVPAGSHNWQVAFADISGILTNGPGNSIGGSTLLSPNTSATADGSHCATITEPTPPLGAVYWYAWRDAASVNFGTTYGTACSSLIPVTTTSATDNGLGQCGGNIPSRNTSGIQTMDKNSVTATQVNLLNVTAPTGVSGTTAFYMDSTANWPSFKPNGNTAYIIPGFTGAWTAGQCATATATTNVFNLGTCGGGGTISNAPQFSMPYYSAAGTTNFIGGTAPPVSPNGVPNFWVTIPAAGLATAPQPVLAGVPGRTVSGASDTIVITDRVSGVTYTNGGAVAVSLPGAGTTGFGSNFCFKPYVTGSGTVVTITPVSGTINGNSTLVMNRGQDALVCSLDNSNYIAFVHDPPATAGSNMTLTRADTSLSFASSAGGGTVTNVATSLPAGQLLAGNTYPDIVKTDLSGDATTTGSAVTTVVKVNGVAYGTSPSTNTVPVVTSSNTVTYEAVPNAALAHAATTVNGQTCTLGSTCNANAGSTAHGVAVNEGDGSAIASTAAGAQNAILSGVTSADPTYKSLVDLSSELYAGTTTGSVNVLAGCPTRAATALTTGMQVSFLPNLANTTTTPTFNLCTLGAATIIKTNAAALAANDLITTIQAVVRYDGTNWELQNPQTTSGGGGAPVLSTITAASATNTIASGNFAQIWNWAQTSNSQAAFTFGETSAATAGTVTSNLANQSNVTISTASASTATPLSVLQGSVTGTVAFPALQVATTWNNGSLVGQGVVFRLTDTAHAAGSKIFNIFGGAAGTSSEFSVDTAGGTTIGGVVRVPTVPATGTGTTAIPNTFLNPGASAVTTFNTAGTFLGVNANSGFTGNMLDFHVNGGASVAALNYQGNLTVNSCTGCGTGNLNIASTRWGILAWSHANGGINTSGFITGSGGNVCTTAGDTAATATNPSYKTCGTGASANTTQYLGVANGDTFIGSSSNPNNLDLITFAKMSATTTTRAWMAEISDVGTLSNLGTSDSPTGNNVAAIRFSSVAGDTNYMLVLCNAAACNATSTGVAGDTNKHHFEVRMNDVTGTATGCVDGTCVSSTTDYPSSVATGGFGLGLVLDNTTTTVETLSWSTTTVTTAN